MSKISFENIVKHVKTCYGKITISLTDKEVHAQATIEYNRFLEEEVCRVKMWALQDLLRKLGFKNTFMFHDWPDNERWHASQYQRRVKTYGK
jgi:hypothetical protein